MYSICYVEEFMTQYLDHLLIAMYKAIVQTENKVVKKNIPICFKLLGRYTQPRSYGPLVISAIRNELASFYTYTSPGSLRAFGYLFGGSIEMLRPGMNIEYVREVLKDFMLAVEKTVIDFLDIDIASNLVETIETLVYWLIRKQNEEVDVTLCR